VEDRTRRSCNHTSNIFWNNDQTGSSHFSDNRKADKLKEVTSCDCASQSPAFQERWCAPVYEGDIMKTAGWRWWTTTWFPALVDAFSCGFRADQRETDVDWRRMKELAKLGKDRDAWWWW
jgi:hypothetical protein